MKHKLLSGLTAIVMLSSVSVSLSSHAEQTPLMSDVEEELTETQTVVGTAATQPETTEEVSSHRETDNTVVKVGEYQSNSASDGEFEAIATVQAHLWNNRQAATLYVRNIPVLTFVEEEEIEEARGKREQVTSSILSTPNFEGTKKMPNSNVVSTEALKQPSSDSPSQASSDPVTRASQLAAKLNQLNRYQIDANSIGVRWNEDQQNYSIEIEGQTLVVIDSDTILPDTTQNLAEDALQATNRLRRQMGYAPPLNSIEGKSPLKDLNNKVESAFNRQVINVVEGWASWYGPGFHGALTANGERFNQYEMTAAHRSLPFGTTVRVTNTNNGRSVVVRINDRGPFTGGRIIDLSVAAAEAIGMISSGVAPVKVEVLEP